MKNSIACTKGIFPHKTKLQMHYPWTKVPPLAKIDHRSFNRVIQLEKREKMHKNRETFFKKYIFNWRIIALQCFFGFCHKTMWISHSAAVAAKSLQLCPTLCDPIDGTPWGSPVPGILQARTLEWVAISFSNARKWKLKVKSLSLVRLSDPMDCTHWAAPSMGFSRQECWSGVPLPSPESAISIHISLPS